MCWASTRTRMLRSSHTLWDRVHPHDAAGGTRLDRQRRQRAAQGRAGRRRPGATLRRGISHRSCPTDSGAGCARRASARWWARTCCVTGSSPDVTERRQLADQLRASQRQELIGALVSGVAHNFNNMLAAVLPNLERASQVATGELRQEIARRARRGQERRRPCASPDAAGETRRAACRRTGGCRRPRARRHAHVPPDVRPAHHARDLRAALGADRAGAPQRAATGDPQPVHQRARRRGRGADAPDRSGGAAAGPGPRRRHGARHRDGHVRGHTAPRRPAILHDEGPG